MDPPLVKEASFTVGSNPSSYSLAEMLSFPMGGAGSLGLTMRNFGGGDGSIEESTVTDQSGNGGRKRRKEDNHDMNESNGEIIKASASSDEDGGSKTEAETNSGTSIKIITDKNKPEPPKDYIHVRARRGQATDSHSLAERARREKISERMKILQDLVPGCNKVIGKALVLDEIINYIQSLQNQVEFMSLKLEAVNSRMNLTMEDFPAKDLLASSPTFDAGGMIFGSQGPIEYSQGTTPQQAAEWLHIQLGTAFDRPT